MDLLPLLRLMVEKNASDLFLSVDACPHLKIDGHTHAVGDEYLIPSVVKEMVYSILNDKQRLQFEQTMECNLALSVGELGRFRVNVFYERGEVAMVARLIPSKVPEPDALGLPAIAKQLVLEKRGLVLVVGAAGSGKSTTLASLVDYRARHTDGHILTIEDPIEFLLPHRNALIDQREVGIDTLSFSSALHNALREAPDLIMIGEIRDQETMQHAITYAETGHLCLATLHANNANQTLERILNFFPDSKHAQVKMDLALNLRGIISQRLITANNGRLALACEILVWTAYVADLIRHDKVGELKDLMGKSNELGMKTFDQSLYELYARGLITSDEALRNADSKTDLGLKIRLHTHDDILAQNYSVVPNPAPSHAPAKEDPGQLLRTSVQTDKSSHH